MKTIYKYPLQTLPKQQLRLPRGARPLYVSEQKDDPWLWAIVDPRESVQIEMKIITHVTGSEVHNDLSQLTYLGTYMLDGGGFVGHVFYEEEV